MELGQERDEMYQHINMDTRWPSTPQACDLNKLNEGDTSGNEGPSPPGHAGPALGYSPGPGQEEAPWRGWRDWGQGGGGRAPGQPGAHTGRHNLPLHRPRHHRHLPDSQALQVCHQVQTQITSDTRILAITNSLMSLNSPLIISETRH